MKKINIFKILEILSIETVISKFIKLKRKGSNFIGLCPFHNDKNPSLIVSEKKKIFKCFSCDTGGNVIKFVQLYKEWSFKETLSYLDKQYNLNLNLSLISIKNKQYSKNQKEIIEIFKRVNLFFKYNLQTALFKNNIEISNYCTERKIVAENIEYFSIGLATSNSEFLNFVEKEGFNKNILVKYGLLILKNNSYLTYFRNRIIFPIINEENMIVGFSGRVFKALKENDIKYLNSKESSIFKKNNILYNENIFHGNKAFRELIICEGFFDVIAYKNINHLNVLALMGNNINEQKIKSLFSYSKTIILSLDNDLSGIKMCIKLIYLLVKNKFSVKIVDWSNSEFKDPASLLENNKASNLNTLVTEHIGWFKYIIKQYKKYSDFERKKYILENTIKIINIVPNLLDRHIYIEHMKNNIGVKGNLFEGQYKPGNLNINMNNNIVIKNNEELNILMYLITNNKSVNEEIWFKPSNEYSILLFNLFKKYKDKFNEFSPELVYSQMDIMYKLNNFSFLKYYEKLKKLNVFKHKEFLISNKNIYKNNVFNYYRNMLQDYMINNQDNGYFHYINNLIMNILLLK